MPAAVDSAFDLAFWFADKALDADEYLQPQKLHNLMYLAQAYYAVAYHGHKLVPAIFVALETGPVEPAIWRAFAQGRPEIEVDRFMDPDIERFIDSIWRRFGHHSPEYLARLVRRCPAYKAAMKRSDRAEIPLEHMRRAFSRAQNAPGVDQVVRPKLMRSHTGRAVAVKAWNPGATGGSNN